MLRTHNKFLVISMFAAILCMSKQATVSAQVVTLCVNCSNTATQLLEYAKQIEQTENQINQLTVQIQQLQNMERNSIPVPTQIYTNALADMNNVKNLLNTGSQMNLTTSSASAGTFSSYVQSGSLMSQQQKYAAWSSQASDNITAALKAAGAQANQLNTDDAVMQGLQAQNASATGFLQAIQNVGQIAAQGVRESEKLRQLIMVQIQLEANKQAVDADQQADANARSDKFFSVSHPSTSGGQGF